MLLEFLTPLIGKIFDRVIPDPAAAAQAKLDLLTLTQNGELKELEADTSLKLAQMKVNEAEAGSGNWFVAGWRPAFGWTCVCGCAWNWILLPAFLFLCALVGHPLHGVSPADLTDMLPMLGGMLGFGYYRSKEKIAGVTR